MTIHRTTVLHKIAEKESSASSLAKNMGKEESNLHRIVKILEKQGMIEQTRSESGPGHDQIFYGPTNQGIFHLVRTRLDAKEFLKILFNTYKQTNQKITISIDDIFAEYEKTNMSFSENYIPLLIENFIPHWFSYREFFESPRTLANEIACHGSLTEHQLNHMLDLRKQNDLKFSHNLEKMLKMMIIRYDNSRKKKFRLSHMGILLLLEHLRYSNGFVLDKFSNEASEFISNLRAEYRDSLPQIFRDWKRLREIQEEPAIIDSIISPVENEMTRQLVYVENDNYSRISNILKLMAKFHIDYARNLVTACIDMLCDLLKSPKDRLLVKKIALWVTSDKHTEPPRMRKEIRQRLDLIRKCVETIEQQSSFLPLDESKKLLDRIGLSTNWKVRTSVLEPNMASQITFLFFTMFRQKLDEKSFMDLHGVPYPFGVSEETSKNIILDKENSRQDKITRYNNFLAEKKISNQYNKWIDQIIEFESKNIEELKTLKIEQ